MCSFILAALIFDIFQRCIGCRLSPPKGKKKEEQPMILDIRRSFLSAHHLQCGIPVYENKAAKEDLTY